MNNSQFRKLVLDTPARKPGSEQSNPTSGTTSRRDGATPLALGSRMRSSIPMTPRSVGGVDFARQLAEQRSSSNNAQPKKFRSTAAPKGSKLAEGYIDRTKQRVDEDEDEKAARIKSLEEMMKLQQIDEATFIKLRDEILGGEVESTHLVKGLDYKLLERVRRGEDVLGGKKEDVDEPEAEEDLDEEFDKLEEKDVVAIEKEKTAKKGQMAPPSLVPGKKRNRDQILAELKAAREAAKQAAQPSLGSKFKKVGAPRSTTRIERDVKGREVLIVVDENGNEKRKIRKVQAESEPEKGHGLLMPDKDAKPLGMEVPEIPLEPEPEDEDMNIFDDAGDDYDPLAGLEEEDSDSDKEDGEVADSTSDRKPKPEESALETAAARSMAPPPPRSNQPRNYFGDSESPSADEDNKPKAFSDPTILAALKKASTLNPISKAPESAEEAAKEARRKKMLQQDDRDMQDMDMGFGSSRFEDEADFDDTKVKLSEWGRDADDEDGKGDGKSKRKRGPKKRKGDVNSAADVLKVMESRKASGS